VEEDGINFCVFSRHATAMRLLLYADATRKRPFQVVELDPEQNRSFFFWHVKVLGLRPEHRVSYTWQVDGPRDPGSGMRFDPSVELLDPWARVVTDVLWQRQQAGGRSMRAMVPPDRDYDWEGDAPLERPCEEEIIYELHVGGFTRDPGSGVCHPGTFAGLAEKIPYLKELGVTAVELMPIMAFDEQDVPETVRQRGLRNFWGYSTHSFFSPHPGYCVTPLAGSHRTEFKDLVKALHRAGIGVIMDVVFNHTAEGGAGGPVINFKGFFNQGFYHLDPGDPSRYRDYSGCGNTLNCNHPLVARFIIECLEYWVREFHVDGFRFDLASILARGEDGRPMRHAPVVWAIEFSTELARTRLIAEAWDAGGLYQVGGFPGFRWAEWNGRYRDLVRQFVRGDKGLIAEFATRLTGSSDLYEEGGRLPVNSINFVTCHDGFTLWDLVSYNRKHNQANGEENRDGEDNNLSWNCGTEGETEDPEILSLRCRQARNFMAILLLSQGIPMLLAGDEVLRSQGGNNNVYCQDNPLGWFDWSLVRANRQMLVFTRAMIRFRRRHPSLMRRRFLSGRILNVSGLPDITWHGPDLGPPSWDDGEARFLACTVSRVQPGEEDLFMVFNMDERPVRIVLPAIAGRRWYLAVDTGDRRKPVREPEEQLPLEDALRAGARSVLVCESRP